MAQYVGILDGQRRVWGVRIPDAPGCHGGGETPEAAIADAICALREYAAHQRTKGITLAPPRTVQEIMRDKEAEFDPEAGEAIVMVPLILDQARPVKANISLDAGLLEAIDEEAERRGLTRSSFMASAAVAKIGKSGELEGTILFERDSPALRKHKEAELLKYLADAPKRLKHQIIEEAVARAPEHLREHLREELRERMEETEKGEVIDEKQGPRRPRRAQRTRSKSSA